MSSLQVQENDDDIQVDSRVNGAYTNYENRDFDEKKSRHVDEGLHQRITRRYKEFQEFKFKNFFGKQTVVRKTEISMDMYADRYKEDLQVEKQRKPQDRQSSIECNFEFKDSKQNSRENYASPTASMKSNVSTPIHQRQFIKNEFQGPNRNKQKRIARFRAESVESEDEDKKKVEYSQSWRFGTLRGKSINRKKSLTEKNPSIRKTNLKKHTIDKKKNERLRWTFKSKQENGQHNENVSVTEPKRKWTFKKLKENQQKDEGEISQQGIIDQNQNELTPATKKKWTLKKQKEKNEIVEGELAKPLESKKNRWTLRIPKVTTPNDENIPRLPPLPKKKWTLRSSPSVDDDLEASQSDTNIKSLRNLKKKHRTKPKELEIEETTPKKTAENLTAKRRSWSVKKHFSSSIDSYSSAKDDVHSSIWNLKKWKNSDLLSRWKQRTMQVLSQPNLSTVGLEGSSPEKKQKITLRIWKRNKNVTRSASVEDIQQAKPESKSFLNLKYFNKKGNEEQLSVEEVIIDNKKLTHKERLENAKDRAKQAVNEQIQKLHFFRAQQNSKYSEDATRNQRKKTAFDEDLDDEIAAANIEEIQNSPAAIWASEQEFNQSINPLETNDFNMNMPKVLIRQQSYENREPTLVITMTSSRLHPHISPLFRGRRLESLDSNDSDCWIPNTYSHAIVESDVIDSSPCLRHNEKHFKKEETRRTSVDVFQSNAPFANFDNELEDIPVVTIEQEVPPPPPSSSPPREELYETIYISHEPNISKQNENRTKESRTERVKTTRPRSSFRRPKVHPPNVPERTASMVNLTRPIIKQGSLRRKLSADLDSKNMGIGKVNTLINQFENSLEDLTESTNLPVQNTFQKTEDSVIKLKTFEVKKRAIAPAVPILSPRLTTTTEIVPFSSNPVNNIPIIAPIAITTKTIDVLNSADDANNNKQNSSNNISNNIADEDSINVCTNVGEVMETNNNFEKENCATTKVNTKEDENYFSLSDEGEFEINF